VSEAWLRMATGLAYAVVRSRRDGPASGGSRPQGGADDPNGPSDRTSYSQAVDALRDLVVARVPEGAEVLVISRGDPNLVDLAARRGRHFPADLSGAWAGFHPALGAAATTLDDQRGDADHLVVPATAAWWFQTYPELVDLLAGGRCLVDEPGIGSIWELPPRAGRPAPASPPERELRPYRSATVHAASLVASLVGEGEVVLVISRGDPERIELEPAIGRHFPSSRDGTYLGHPADDRHALELLQLGLAEGATWLVIHADVEWWADAYPAWWERLHDEHRVVVERPGVCRLFQLVPTTTWSPDE
jgi:hypothetical protein